MAGQAKPEVLGGTGQLNRRARIPGIGQVGVALQLLGLSAGILYWLAEFRILGWFFHPSIHTWTYFLASSLGFLFGLLGLFWPSRGYFVWTLTLFFIGLFPVIVFILWIIAMLFVTPSVPHH